MFAADREFMRFIDVVNCIMLDWQVISARVLLTTLGIAINFRGIDLAFI
jgi:hypothetical protein